MAFALFLSCACSKNDKDSEGDGGSVIKEELLPMTREMNALNGTLVTTDAENCYYQQFDNDRVKLCKRNRTSGEVSVLAELPWNNDSNADVSFTDLSIRDEYLYFIMFDGNEDIRYAWCRVPVNLSSEYEIIHTFGWDYEGFHFDDRDNVLMLSENEIDGSQFLGALQFESGALVEEYPLPEGHTPCFIHDGFIYTRQYAKTDGKMHMQIFRSPVDRPEPELVWSDPGQMTVQCMASGSRLYVSDFYGGRLFEADLDGQNARMLAENVRILKMNLFKDTLYFLLDRSTEYAPGIYSYAPGQNGFSPLYQADDIVFGPIITGNGDIWFTKKLWDSNFRYGRLCYLDSENELHEI